MEKFQITKEGYQRLKAEIENLKNVERPNVIKQIAEAREHGDLKENAEYHAAREEQSFIEGRIIDIESKLALSQIIDVTKISNNGRVIFGATVELINVATDEHVRYQIVGEDEADIKQGKISYSSPIARALIGKMEGDVVDVTTPSAVFSYEIDNVEYLG